MKVLTFGGTFIAQIIFHHLPSSCALECSISAFFWSHIATWKAIFTENSCLLFSFQINLSHGRLWQRGMASISDLVLGATKSVTFALSHYHVFLSIRSATLKVFSSAPLKTGLYANQFDDDTRIWLPSPTLNLEPTKMTSLAASKLHKTNDGLQPNSVFKKE